MSSPVDTAADMLWWCKAGPGALLLLCLGSEVLAAVLRADALGQHEEEEVVKSI